jgi:hypothetical protein
MRDSEVRGLILEALYNQRRKDLVNLDDEVGGPPLPHGATESILRQLVKKGLVERPIQPLNGLGNARITAYGIDVVQGTTRPPLSILLHQRITVQDVQVGEGNIQNVSDTTLDVPIDHSEASHDKPKSSFERISKRWKHIMEKFGWV